MATVKDAQSGWMNGGYALRIRMERTAVDVAGNRSQVRARVWVVSSGGSNGRYYYWGPVNSWHGQSINGTNVYDGWITRTLPAGGSVLILDNARWVPHNADGTKTVASAASFENGWTNYMTFSTSLVLDAIPRASTPTSGNFTTGSATTIQMNRATSSFTHNVTYKFGNQTGTISSNAGASVSWTPPHSLMSAFPNGTSGSVTITVQTKNGSTVIGTKSITKTITAAASVRPTVSAVNWTDGNAVVASNIGAFVQGVSEIKGTVTGDGIYGSTIKTKRIIADGVTYAENQIVRTTKSGSVSARGEVVDSRGRTGTLTSNLTILAYNEPQIFSFDVFRATSGGAASDTGTYLRMSLSAAVASLSVGGSQKNAMTIKVSTRPVNGQWQERNVINPSTLGYDSSVNITGGSIFNTSTSYEVKVEITDRVNPSTSNPSSASTIVATAAVTMDMNGTNVGIGKYWERGVLDVGGQIYQNSQAVVDITQTMSMWHMNRQSNGRTSFGTREATTPYGAGETALMLYPVGDSTGGAFAVMKDGSSSSNVLLRLMDNGDLNIQGRVNSDHQPYAMAAGKITIEPSSANTPTKGTVTFPVGRFTQPPNVITMATTTVPGTSVTGVSAINETTTSVDIYLTRSNTTSTGLRWQAVQMTATSAVG